jgi:hypothetical protein
VDTVVESITPVNAELEPTSGHVADDGQIVVIRPQVVENVGHVLGNMFQRIYHLVERTRDGDVVMAADLESNLRRLEDFLQLFMDYVSPLSLTLQSVPLADVAQSLAQQIGDAVGGAVTIETAGPTDARLLVDAGRLARAFDLLRLQLCPEARSDEGIQLQTTARPGARLLTLEVTIPSGCLVGRSSASEIQWSVAEKLLEIHGGALQQSSTESGEVLWEIMLPLQC